MAAEKEKPIKKGKLADIVVDRMSAMIRSGELKAGDRLPTERALAESMGVSRTVIRQAIQILADKNVLEIRNGCGYVRQLSFDEIVNNISQAVMPDDVSMQEIMEVRTVLEMYIVRKAAENITEEQIDELQKSIDKMKMLMETGGNGSTQEEAFHRGLAEAAGNNVLKGIYSLCENLLSSTQLGTWQGARISGSPNTAVADHQAILDAIKAGNVRQAEMLMQAHMDYAYHNLEQLYKDKDKEEKSN